MVLPLHLRTEGEEKMKKKAAVLFGLVAMLCIGAYAALTSSQNSVSNRDSSITESQKPQGSRVLWRIELRKPVVGESTSGSIPHYEADVAQYPRRDLEDVCTSIGETRGAGLEEDSEFHSSRAYDMEGEWEAYIRFYGPAEPMSVDDGDYGTMGPPPIPPR